MLFQEPCLLYSNESDYMDVRGQEAGAVIRSACTRDRDAGKVFFFFFVTARHGSLRKKQKKPTESTEFRITVVYQRLVELKTV